VLVVERRVRLGNHLAGHISHKPSGTLPLLHARPANTFPAARHHRS